MKIGLVNDNLGHLGKCTSLVRMPFAFQSRYLSGHAHVFTDTCWKFASVALTPTLLASTLNFRATVVTEMLNRLPSAIALLNCLIDPRYRHSIIGDTTSRPPAISNFHGITKDGGS
jgi:hypothetical protein